MGAGAELLGPAPVTVFYLPYGVALPSFFARAATNVST
jgi:hypothetical protein